MPNPGKSCCVESSCDLSLFCVEVLFASSGCPLPNTLFNNRLRARDFYEVIVVEGKLSRDQLSSHRNRVEQPIKLQHFL